MPEEMIQIRMKRDAPGFIRLSLGSVYTKEFVRRSYHDAWVVSRGEFEKYLKPTGYFEEISVPTARRVR